jgi:hypothetical protein
VPGPRIHGDSKTLLPYNYARVENTTNTVSKLLALDHVILNHRQSGCCKNQLKTKSWKFCECVEAP